MADFDWRAGLRYLKSNGDNSEILAAIQNLASEVIRRGILTHILICPGCHFPHDGQLAVDDESELFNSCMCCSICYNEHGGDGLWPHPATDGGIKECCPNKVSL